MFGLSTIETVGIIILLAIGILAFGKKPLLQAIQNGKEVFHELATPAKKVEEAAEQKQ